MQQNPSNMQPYPDLHGMNGLPHPNAASQAPVSGPSPYSFPPAQQSALMPSPAPSHYAGTQSSYPSYGYPPGAMSHLPASSASASMNGSINPPLPPPQLPAMSQALNPPMAGVQSYPQGPQGKDFDISGQRAPPGMKPRVTATLWEDEGTLCFQVEAKSVCVARREDNHMINGTKLLNVAGMTRGRRDGILKSEKVRHVVKIGPMHLKGVWIPYERALEFANKENITDFLYPLFVEDIASLLYHPTNQTGTRNAGNAHMAALGRRSELPMAQRFIAGATNQTPALHHHHSMSNSIGGPPQTALQPHPSAGRPGLDRAHTFPNTPPTSAGALMGMGNHGNSQEWNGGQYQHIPNPSGQLSIDTGLSNTRSVPTTPATTPPGNVQPGMPYASTQPYDSARSIYSSAPPQPPVYHSHPQQSMGYRQQDITYPKSEMAPPTRSGEQNDVKPTEAEQGNHPTGEDEHDHENEYTTNPPYNAARASYGYTASSTPQSHNDHSHLSPEAVANSPRQNGSGRHTPRTTTTGQTQWSSTFPGSRPVPQGSNVYSVMSSDTRGTPSNASQSSDMYPASGPSQYPPQSYGGANGNSNGASNGGKRAREDDEQDTYSRPDNAQGDDGEVLKRRKTLDGGAVGGQAYHDSNGVVQRGRNPMLGRNNPSRR